MSDPGHNETEALLKALEKRITKEYKKAEAEITQKLDDYLRRYRLKDDKWREWVANGKKTQKEYREWRIGQLAIGKRWREMRQTIAEDLSHVNEIARNMINGTIPEVYAINHNYGTYEIEHGLSVDTSYTLYDRQTVKRLFDDKSKLYHAPGKKLSRSIAAGKEIAWNKQRIQSVLLQAILQGEAIPKIADRLTKQVSNGNRAAAIRNARTMITGAQNAGRIDSYNRAQDMGIEMEKQWVATLDNRTRHEHRVLDGQTANVNGYFTVGRERIRYPGDPQAPAHLIYNCRCTLVASLAGFERDYTDLSIRHSSHLGNLTYAQWKAEKKSTSNPITLPEEKAKRIKGAYIKEYRQK